MLYEERLEAAERLRLAGNALFTAGDATGAMGKCALPAQGHWRCKVQWTQGRGAWTLVVLVRADCTSCLAIMTDQRSGRQISGR